MGKRERREWWVTARGYRAYSGGDENVLELDNSDAFKTLSIY